MTSPQPPYEGRPTYGQHPLLDGTQQFPPPGPGLQPPRNSTPVKMVAIVAAVVVVLSCGGGASLILFRYALKNTHQHPQTAASNVATTTPLGAVRPNPGTGATTEPNVADGARTASPSAVVTTTSAAVAGKLGQPATGDTFQFTVSKVKCGATKVGEGNISKTAQGQFCLVTLTVKNISDTAVRFSYATTTADGPGAVSYKIDDTAMFHANTTNSLPFFDEMNPGNSQTGILVFDIPKNVTLRTVNLDDGATGTVSIAVG